MPILKHSSYTIPSPVLHQNRIPLDSLCVDDIDARLKSLSRTTVWHSALGGLAAYLAWRGYAVLAVADAAPHPGDVIAVLLLAALAAALFLGAWGDLRELFRFEAQVMRGRPARGTTNSMRDVRQGVRQENR